MSTPKKRSPEKKIVLQKDKVKTVASGEQKHEQLKPGLDSGLFSGLFSGHAGHEQRFTPEQLKKIEQFEQNFLSLISHELNTPLMGLINNIYLLKNNAEQNLGLDQNELIERLDRLSQSLKHQLSSLIELTRAEQTGAHLELRELDPQVLFEQLQKNNTLNVRAEKLLNQKIDPVLVDPRRFASLLERLKAALEPERFGEAPGGWVEIEAMYVPNVQVRLTSGPFFSETSVQRAQSKFDEFQAAVRSKMDLSWVAFAEALENEKTVLTRTHSGLGIDLLLAFRESSTQRLNLESHWKKAGNEWFFTLNLSWISLSGVEIWKTLLEQRAARLNTESFEFAVFQIKGVEPDQAEPVIRCTSQALFRAKDRVLYVETTQSVCVLVDDLKREDCQKLSERIQKHLEKTGIPALAVQFFHFPSDALDPFSIEIV